MRDDPRRAIVVRKSVRAAVYTRDGHACLKCGATEDLSLDHIIPLSRGGSNLQTNLQTLCKRCNQRKADKIPDGLDGLPRKRVMFGTRHVRGMKSKAGLKHHRHCDVTLCFCECPIYLFDHPALARALQRDRDRSEFSRVS